MRGERRCAHLETIEDVAPSSEGCEDCLRTRGRWVDLRICMRCGHVGCCDASPNRHARAHWRSHPDHPIVRSFEPGEDWWWCAADDLVFDLPGAPAAPSHPVLPRRATVRVRARATATRSGVIGHKDVDRGRT